MLSFATPWALGFIILPWLVYFLFPPAQAASRQALRVPFFQHLLGQQVQKPNTPPRQRGLLFLFSIIYLLCLLAAMRPQWLGEIIEIPVSGRDLMLALDLSGSMETEDMEGNGKLIDRLSVANYVLREFIERRVGDRVGLIVFGEYAHLHTPFTLDRHSLKTMLTEAIELNFVGGPRSDGMAGKNGTAIGDAIGLAVKHLKERPENQRTLILLTDGKNTAGALQPLEAADLAVQAGIKIYTIGVGAAEIIRQTLFGQRRVNPSQDLDEGVLREIAQKTGGQYFRAYNPQDLARIYEKLDELEPIELDKETYRPMQPLYPWPLGIALSLCLIAIFAVSKRH